MIGKMGRLKRLLGGKENIKMQGNAIISVLSHSHLRGKARQVTWFLHPVAQQKGGMWH